MFQKTKQLFHRAFCAAQEVFMFNLNDGLLAYLFPEAGYWGSMPWYAIVPAVIGVCVMAYLCGSVNSAILISKALYKEDIRTKGSGNAGMTNMLRSYGKGAAGLTLLGDLLKAAIAIFVAGVLFGFQYAGSISVSEMCYVAGMFAVMGHVFPIFHGFKGGKGVLVTATMALILSPIPFLILIAIFIGVVWFTKYISLGSVIAAVLYPVVLNGFFAVFELHTPVLLAFSSILLAILIVWCHRENLVRIGNRTENKFSWGKKKEEPKEENPKYDEPKGYGDED